MVASKKNIALFILAAGSSSRMGQPKQLLPWKDTTLLGNAIRNATSSWARTIYVVLGANTKNIRKEIVHNQIEVVENPDWDLGIGSSIAIGMNMLLKKDIKFDGTLIMLADQPLIDKDYLNLMITSFYNQPERIMATAYKNRAGVPALFDKAYFNELECLKNDFGAKELIAQNESEVFTINPYNKSVDVDTKSEYQNLIKKTK